MGQFFRHENFIILKVLKEIPLIHTYRIVRRNSKYQPFLQMSERYGRIKHCLIQISYGGLLLDKKIFALIHWIYLSNEVS